MVTTIATTAYPIDRLEFPAITICSQSTDVKSVHKIYEMLPELWDPYYKK